MSRIKKRSKKSGSFYYANTWHCGIRLRDCLKTSDREEAQRRLTELEISVERGEYQKGSKKFEKLVADFKKPSVRDEGIIRTHLLPAFRGQRVWDLDIESFLEGISTKQSQSSMNKICATIRKLEIDCPRGISTIAPKLFGIDQILEHEQVLDVIHNFVPEKYRSCCLVSCYSMLRLNDVLGLRKKDVDLKVKGNGIRLVPSKTRDKNPTTLFLPMSRTLAAVFSNIKIRPFGEDDLWFPEIKSVNVTTMVRRAFHRSGIPWGSFKQFRHFGACFLMNAGKTLEELKPLMHHKDIRTTQIYARMMKQNLEGTVSAFDELPAQVGHKQEVK